MSLKLHQIIAVEKGVKTRVSRFLTEAYKRFQKPDSFSGHTKTYERLNEDSDALPPEKRVVQFYVEDLLAQVAEQSTEYFDLVLQKDAANCAAMANIVIDGVTIMQDVPATHLLFLEKRFVDLQTAIESLPVLDPAQEWSENAATGGYRTEPFTTIKTKKTQRPLVMYDATPEHPAQTQLITEDMTIGHWDTTKLSGAISLPRKQQLRKRIQSLLKAVKYARERANGVEIKSVASGGDAIFGYLLK